MAKILFVINEHPNEAFAIGVAKRTAEILRKQGHEVIWEKINPAKTALGKVIRSRKRKKQSISSLFNWDNKKRAGRVRWLKWKHKPDIIYRFHCSDIERIDTQPGNWAEWRGKDFTISNAYSIGKMPIETREIEIKAQYKLLPLGMRKKIRKRVKGGKPYLDGSHFANYLSQTTSQRLTRSAGLTPEEYAKAIAAEIGKDLPLIEVRKTIVCPYPERGHKIPRVYGTEKKIERLTISTPRPKAQPRRPRRPGR